MAPVMRHGSPFSRSTRPWLRTQRTALRHVNAEVGLVVVGAGEGPTRRLDDEAAIVGVNPLRQQRPRNVDLLAAQPR